MDKSFWAVVFICLVCVILFGFFRIVRLIWKRSIRLLHKAFNREFSEKTIGGKTNSSYEISERDFTRIAYKAGYRHPKTEEILINGSNVEIRFLSQSGYSEYNAVVSFELSGSKFSEFSIRTTNPDSTVPTHIAEKIQSEMRRQVGL